MSEPYEHILPNYVLQGGPGAMRRYADGADPETTRHVLECALDDLECRDCDEESSAAQLGALVTALVRVTNVDADDAGDDADIIEAKLKEDLAEADWMHVGKLRDALCSELGVEELHDQEDIHKRIAAAVERKVATAVQDAREDWEDSMAPISRALFKVLGIDLLELSTCAIENPVERDVRLVQLLRTRVNALMPALPVSPVVVTLKTAEPAPEPAQRQKRARTPKPRATKPEQPKPPWMP